MRRLARTSGRENPLGKELTKHRNVPAQSQFINHTTRDAQSTIGGHGDTARIDRSAVDMSSRATSAHRRAIEETHSGGPVGARRILWRSRKKSAAHILHDATCRYCTAKLSSKAARNPRDTRLMPRIALAARSEPFVPERYIIDSEAEEIRPTLQRPTSNVKNTAKQHYPCTAADRSSAAAKVARRRLFLTLFFAEIAHSRSNSSSSNCFWYRSA